MPSRLTRTQINPKIPNELYNELMDFLGNNRYYKLQDIIARGIRLALAEIASERGRPAVQPSGRPVIDQIDQKISDEEIKIDFVDRRSKIESRPAVQDFDICAELAGKLNPQTIETWFKPLKIELDETTRTVVITAPNQVVRDCICSNYSALLEETLGAKFDSSAVAWVIGGGLDLALAANEFEPPPRATAGRLKAELLDYYAVVTENKVTSRDEDAFGLVAHCSPESVRAGVLRSRLKASKPVGSFVYCVKAILQIENAGLGNELYLKLHREVFDQPLLPPMGAEVLSLKQRKERK